MAEGSRIAVELGPPRGQPLVVEWALEELERLEAASAGDSPWRLDGELEVDVVEALRVVSGRLEDRRLLAIAALRPAGAPHGDDVVAGWLGQASELQRLDEVLLSTEYGPDGIPRRIGLELYESAAAVPLRVAGTATGEPTRNEAPNRLRVGLELRHGGERGFAIYDLITAR